MFLTIMILKIVSPRLKKFETTNSKNVVNSLVVVMGRKREYHRRIKKLNQGPDISNAKQDLNIIPPYKKQENRLLHLI